MSEQKPAYVVGNTLYIRRSDLIQASMKFDGPLWIAFLGNAKLAEEIAAAYQPRL